MSLSDFLADGPSGGSSSWADDVVDLPTAPAAREDRSEGYSSRGFDDERNDRGYGEERRYSNDRGFGGDRRGSDRYERGRGRGRGGFESRGERPYTPRSPVELPTEAPFTARVANLSFDSSEDDLSNLFSNLKVSNIRLVRDRDERPKGFGYVEFEDLDSLKSALELSGENVQGRNIRVMVAEPPREDRPRRVDRTDVDTWRRSGPVELPESPRRGGFGGFGGERSGFGGRRNDSSWGSGRGGFASRDRPAERPRLNLKPRTVDNAASSGTTAQKSSKPDPFGGARPVDTDKVLKKVEEKLEADKGEH
ncbi:hypothetical protein BDF20DRAFT_854780 [Mycotypha africana]|uniref:uncharacterized protein n=1 Tax=Mycotypha africana TaxID=64632 RepID=UPI002300D301|nr:uncharacterized protein BDF20DRAFT_854780 [Mycotypha africana]KAI8988271.1 hypothetical protein BDF20DRAFT_854780 [Mycotypha africana]